MRQNEELVALATELAKPFLLETGGSFAAVAAALITTTGNVYTGVCVDLRCGLGLCAERSAAVEMLKRRETTVKMIVAVESGGRVVAPCGTCREFLVQLDPRNQETLVILDGEEERTIGQLLPWQ